MERGDHEGEALSAYADGELSTAERERVEAHLRSCDRCRTEWEALRAMKPIVRRAYADIEVPSLSQRVLAALPAEPIRRRSWKTRGAGLMVALLGLVVLLFLSRLAAVPIKLVGLMSRVLFGGAYAAAGAFAAEPGWAWGLAAMALLLIGISGLSLRQLMKTVRI